MTPVPACEECGQPEGRHYCDGHGSVVHPPSRAERRAGESRRLHTPCPGCPKCESEAAA